jgi:hypothetical protein
MKVVRHKSAAEFLDQAGAWLERAEAENNLILGIAAYFKSYSGQLKVEPYFLTVENNGTIVGAGEMTPPRRLLLTSVTDSAVITLADFMLSEALDEPNRTIPPVFTPSHLRRRGYATSCVAAITQRMLDSGKKFCCLYTDLANPTSNSIYQMIGYQPTCDVQDWIFE